MEKRVVITGVGLVTPLGIGVENNWKNLCAGVSGVDYITRFDTSEYSVKIGAEVKGFDSEHFFGKKQNKRLDLFVQYGIVAARMAMKDSGFQVTEKNCDRVGVITGTGLGGLPTIEKMNGVLLAKGPKRVSPFFIPMVIPNMASGHISMDLGCKGPNVSYATACAASTHAVGEAYRHIKYGMCDTIVSGGAEAVVCGLGITGFASMKALSTTWDTPQTASRPFDEKRDGFVMSEGAGMLILEEYEHAKARGAKIYAEVCGFGLSSDAYHIAAPPEDGEGAVLAMQMAIKDSGLAPNEFDFINAHGTSTPLGDRAETTAIKTVFGDHAKNLAITSSKSMVGHMLGATGGVEAVFTALSIDEQIATPTINHDKPGDGCDLDYVPNVSRKMDIRAALSNSFGFGGTNAVIAMKRVCSGS